MPGFRSGKPWGIGTLTANRTVPAGDQVITWDAVDGDPITGWSGPSYLVDRAGFYLINGGVARLAVPVAAAIRARLRVNTTVVATQGVAVTTEAHAVTVSRYLELQEDDAVQLEVNLSTIASTTAGMNQTWLAVVRLGPVRWTG